MKSYQSIFIAVLIMFVSGCSTKSPSTNDVWLTKTVKVKLPEANLEQDFHDQQLLTFSYKNQQNSLIVMIDADKTTLKVNGLSTLGIRLFDIEYKDGEIRKHQYIFSKELPAAQQILSDIMLCFYPISAWQLRLPKGWAIVEDETHRKLINDQNQIIIDISYQQPHSSKIRKPVYIKHNIFGYQIVIESME